MGKVFRDTPISEITLRKFERPSSKDKKELIRKFCISIGLLQPGDSRDVIIDIFEVLLNAKNKEILLSSKDIEKEIRDTREEGVTSSNIRRQLVRLKRMNIIENIKNEYRLKEFNTLEKILEEMKKFILEPTFQRINEYAKLIDDS